MIDAEDCFLAKSSHIVHFYSIVHTHNDSNDYATYIAMQLPTHGKDQQSPGRHPSYALHGFCDGTEKNIIIVRRRFPHGETEETGVSNEVAFRDYVNWFSAIIHKYSEVTDHKNWRHRM
jgi:hypothetical protein